jgi:hypothetical protein
MQSRGNSRLAAPALNWNFRRIGEQAKRLGAHIRCQNCLRSAGSPGANPMPPGVQSFALQLSKDDTQCLSDEDMIIDNGDLSDGCTGAVEPPRSYFRTSRKVGAAEHGLAEIREISGGH